MKFLGALFFGLGAIVFGLQLVRPELAARLNMPPQPRKKLIILTIVSAVLALLCIAMMRDSTGSNSSSDNGNSAIYGTWDCASTLPEPVGKNGTVAFGSNGVSWDHPDGSVNDGDFRLTSQILTLSFGAARYHADVTDLERRKLVLLFNGDNNPGLVDETVTCVR